MHDQLVALGITQVPAPNTIAKYFPVTRKPPNERARQSWRTFLANHRHEIWAMDFFTMPTIFFQVLYVLIIISHDRRMIRHVAVTATPTADWVVQRLREAMPFGEQPRYLIHDNDQIFRSQAVLLQATEVKAIRAGIQRPQQNGVAERVKLLLLLYRARFFGLGFCSCTC
ncbi:MAG TPA: hypothetical protein VGL77_01950 [Armatimonadota bacterium]|jgi:transposase InsO family protein